MIVVVNGEPCEVRRGATVVDVLRELHVLHDRGLHQGDSAEGAAGVAVARNGEVVLRSRWADVELDADDRLEVLQAVQGG